MGKNNFLLIIGVLFQIILIGCEKCDKNVLEQISIENWNNQTLEFLDKKSNFSSYNYHENHNYPWIVVDGFGNNTIEYEVKHMLKYRAILINELIKTYKVISCNLDIRELYHDSRILYIIRDDKKNIYFVEIYSVDRKIIKSYLVIDSSQKLNYESWFDEVPVFERNYFFSFEDGFFRKLEIYSKFHYENDSLIIEYPYALMSED